MSKAAKYVAKIGKINNFPFCFDNASITCSRYSNISNLSENSISIIFDRMIMSKILFHLIIGGFIDCLKCDKLESRIFFLNNLCEIILTNDSSGEEKAAISSFEDSYLLSYGSCFHSEDVVIVGEAVFMARNIIMRKE